MKKNLSSSRANIGHLERNTVIGGAVERSRFLHFGRNDMIILLVCCYISLFYPSSVHAQSASLSISPPVVEILIAPNKTASQTFTLKTTGENIDVVPELHLVKPSDSNGHVTIDLSPLDQSAIPLAIKITGPNDMPTLTFEAASTDVPQDIYLALVFKTNPDESPFARQSLGVGGAISSLILVTINPSAVIPIDLQIEQFSPSFFHDSWTAFTITPELRNNTAIMIRPEGKYEIISPSGKTVHSLPLYPNLILGNSSRVLTPNLTWAPKWSNIGPYRLRLTITTTGGTKLSETEKVVWIIPLRITIILVVTVIFLLTLIFKRTRLKVV